mgnify:CR=1 FL=1
MRGKRGERPGVPGRFFSRAFFGRLGGCCRHLVEAPLRSGVQHAILVLQLRKGARA